MDAQKARIWTCPLSAKAVVRRQASEKKALYPFPRCLRPIFPGLLCWRRAT